MKQSLLSTRTLEFTGFVTRFSCVTSCTQTGRHLRYRTDGYRDHFQGDSKIFPTAFDTLASAREYWWGVVARYTTRQLSVPAHRPLAISGLAERFHQQLMHLSDTGLHETYIAGHWSGDLPGNLAWHVDDQVWPRPKEHQGPSWSWLSVSSRIWSPKPELGAEEGTIELCDYTFQLKDEMARFGAATDATLTVRCCIGQVLLKDERQRDKIANMRRSFGDDFLVSRKQDATTERGRNWLYKSALFDTCDGLQQDWNLKEVLFVPIKDYSSAGSVSGIIVQHESTIAGTRRFRRIGFSQIWYGKDMFNVKTPGGIPNWTKGWHREVIQLI